ncbi:DUF1642 domain-containing protein [Listeria valentina]|uniref:DUF1642 domain-containing protein n=1 Tax=Listeria valentina TaxID=2705293 RepID=UPI00142FEC0C|nr:DUF1642 domain-containing protein [Listeria valentina]
MTFKKGDRVKHKEFDLIGVVKRVDDDISYWNEPVLWLEDENEDCYFCESEFEKIEVQKVPSCFDEWVKKCTHTYWSPAQNFYNFSIQFFNGELTSDLEDWLEGSCYGEERLNIVLDALQNGYEVEQDDQLYYVRFPNTGEDEAYLNYELPTKKLRFMSKEEGGGYQTKFTESEIRTDELSALDSRFWKFAVPAVEEEEE